MSHEDFTPTLALMELLAIRLSWLTTPAKSLVIPLKEGGNVFMLAAPVPSPLHPQGVGRGCKAAEAATTTHQGEG